MSPVGWLAQEVGFPGAVGEGESYLLSARSWASARLGQIIEPTEWSAGDGHDIPPLP